MPHLSYVVRLSEILCCFINGWQLYVCAHFTQFVDEFTSAETQLRQLTHCKLVGLVCMVLIVFGMKACEGDIKTIPSYLLFRGVWWGVCLNVDYNRFALFVYNLQARQNLHSVSQISIFYLQIYFSNRSLVYNYNIE